jgi:hypothetical protein
MRFAALLLAGLASPSLAATCGTADCFRGFTPKGPLPASLPVIPVSTGPTVVVSFTRNGADAGFSLVGEGAVLDPLPQEGDAVDVISDLQLVSPSFCPQRVTRLTFGPAVALPEKAGTLDVAALEGPHEVFNSLYGGSCPMVQVSGVTVVLQPSAELAPWLEVMKTSVSVGGHAWAVTPQWGDRPRFELFGICGNVAGTPPGLTRGPHYAELQVHVAGAAADPPALAFAVDVECPGCGCHQVPLGGALLAALLRALRLPTRGKP